MALTVIGLINPVRWACGAPEVGVADIDRLVDHAHQVLSEESMPTELAGWHRAGFKSEERERDSPFGRYSARWEYRLDRFRGPCSVVHYPFVGWHELITCYESIDWAARSRRVDRGIARRQGLGTIELRDIFARQEKR